MDFKMAGTSDGVTALQVNEHILRHKTSRAII